MVDRQSCNSPHECRARSSTCPSSLSRRRCRATQSGCRQACRPTCHASVAAGENLHRHAATEPATGRSKACRSRVRTWRPWLIGRLAAGGSSSLEAQAVGRTHGGNEVDGPRPHFRPGHHVPGIGLDVGAILRVESRRTEKLSEGSLGQAFSGRATELDERLGDGIGGVERGPRRFPPPALPRPQNWPSARSPSLAHSKECALLSSRRRTLREAEEEDDRRSPRTCRGS